MTIEELRARIAATRTQYDAACVRVAAAASAVEALPDDTPQERADQVFSEFDDANAEATRLRTNMERDEALITAREAHPVPTTPPPGDVPERREHVEAGDEWIYQPDGQHGYLRDLAFANRDPAARARLERHQKQAIDHLKTRGARGQQLVRDLSQTAGAGGEFLPPNYMADLLVLPLRIGRPFANKIPKMALPATGNTITVPRLVTGTATAIQTADNAAVQETDATTDSLTATVRTIAGQQDVSRQELDRSEPAIQDLLFQDLARDYDTRIDLQLLAGSGTGQHAGIRGVSGAIAVSYTDASPTVQEFILKVYDVRQRMISAGALMPNLMVMHPQRTSWLASQWSTSWPAFRIGDLNGQDMDQSTGTQANLAANTLAGLEIIEDPNIATNRGAGTNEDEVYILDTSALRLAEGPLQTRVFEEIGSGTLTVRLQVWAYSLFLATRQPKAIGIISGTGLVAPTF